MVGGLSFCKGLLHDDVQGVTVCTYIVFTDPTDT